MDILKIIGIGFCGLVISGILKEYKNYIIGMNPSNAVERVNKLRIYMLGRLTSAVANLI